MQPPRIDTHIHICIDTASFSAQTLDQQLAASPAVGAVVHFIGLVREHGDRPDVVGLRLEHYAGMTERVLYQHCQAAAARFALESIVLIHRVGDLALGEPVVGLAVSSAHRQAAFDAIQFLMDFLKHDAPFWKQELTKSGESFWVEQKTSDLNNKKRW